MDKQPKLPSDRSFGFTFAVVFALLGGWLYWRGNQYGLPAFLVSAAFAFLSLTIPRLLHPLNVVWMKFGLLLNKIVSPIVLGAIFFIVITPVGLFFRVTGRDALRRAFEKSASTYWIERTPPGPNSSSFPRQF